MVVIWDYNAMHELCCDMCVFGCNRKVLLKPFFNRCNWLVVSPHRLGVAVVVDLLQLKDSCGGMGMSKGKGWSFSCFWLSRPPFGRPARWAISSVVERAPDNCVVVPRL
jgi:hypothetical protein